MSDEIHYLTPMEIYEIAAQAIGKVPDARDPHLVRAAAARPTLQAFGAEAYPTLMDKAAALLHALAAHHVFWDGNKRAATSVTRRFLERNGVLPTWTQDEIYNFVLEVAQNRVDLPQIVTWLVQHTQPAPSEASSIVTRYLTVDEAIYINEQFIGGKGIHTIVEGKRAVRDIGLLEASVVRPMQSAFGEDAFPGLRGKASALLHAIARNHPFADGNKRTATVSALFFLSTNGLRVLWNQDEALHWILDLAEGQQSIASFADWLPVETAISMPEADAMRDMNTIAAILTEQGALLAELALR
ncbi:MAG: type II toxin-antitoxin system death-on-curing family toxin [Anaerolineae bacterium]|nr:type II toxin-antitoxin system death-on-curing family toxin [Anaerolineae bacterium]